MTARLHLIVLMLGIALGMPPAALPDEVPFMPTPTGVVDAMLSIAGVGEKDYLFDLGSGDGRIVIAAAKRFHARAVGIELDGTLVAQSRESAAREGVSDRVEFLRQDIFASDFRNATVLSSRSGLPRSVISNPLVVKIPAPIMLAITTLVRGKRPSFLSSPTIAPGCRPASCGGIVAKHGHYTRSSRGPTEAIPAGIMTGYDERRSNRERGRWRSTWYSWAAATPTSRR